MKTLILSLILAAIAVAQSVPPGGGKPLRISVDDVTYSSAPQLYLVPGTGISYSMSCASGKCSLTINAATDANQAANLVKAGPASGADAAPAYRALVARDLSQASVFGALSKRSEISLWDEFIGGNTVNGSVGELGWASGGTISAAASESGESGIRSIATGTTSGNVAYLALSGAYNSGNRGLYADDAAWEMTARVKPVEIDSTITITFGLASNYTVTQPALSYTGIIKRTSDTNWTLCTCSGGLCTYVDTTVAVSATWTWLRLYKAGSSIYASIGGGAPVSSSTNIATGFGNIAVNITTAENAAKTINIGAFGLYYSSAR